MTDRHEQVIATYKTANAEYPADEVVEKVLAVIPNLTEQDLMDHLFVESLLHNYRIRSRH